MELEKGKSELYRMSKLTKKTTICKIASKDSFTCIQCFERCFKEKRDFKFASMCRADKSSVTRHKSRWHTLPSNIECTIVPTNSIEIDHIKQKYSFESETPVANSPSGNKECSVEECTDVVPPHTILLSQRKANSEMIEEENISKYAKPTQSTLLGFRESTELEEPSLKNIIESLKFQNWKSKT